MTSSGKAPGMKTLYIDPALCVTHKTNPSKVIKYQDALSKGSQFPPIEVVVIGEYFYVKDGAHRCAAHKLNNEPILALVFEPDDYSSFWLIGSRISMKK